MLKRILAVLVVILILIQFIRPEKNNSNDNTYALDTKYTVPENVSNILAVACNDCHSNNTRYPWYSNIQPVAWWLNSHVEEGKEHLNFSEFTNRPLAYQYHKLEETVEEVEERKMPLPSYTNLGLHVEANLSDEQRTLLIDWAKSQIQYLEQTYPKDSLIRKR
ncbi:MAG: heme-binding domain-containing protein [Chitinophagales bacterium]